MNEVDLEIEAEFDQSLMFGMRGGVGTGGVDSANFSSSSH